MTGKTRRPALPIHPLSDRFRALEMAFPRRRMTIPTLQLPRLDLPQFKMLDEAAARWAEANRPLLEMGQRVAKQFEEMDRLLAPMRETFAWVAEQEAQCERLEAIGWLPHSTSPYNLVQQDAEDQLELDEAVHAYYEANWPAIADSLAEEMEASELDEEAKSTFREALKAHEAGLYRCAARLLFPEIERVARVVVHGGAMDKMASQDRLREAIGRLTPVEMSSTGIAGLRLYTKLTEHLYAHIKDPDALAKVLADPVPNRHATVHGYVSYSSAKSSVNAIIIADYLLQAISTLKRLALSEAA